MVERQQNTTSTQFLYLPLNQDDIEKAHVIHFSVILNFSYSDWLLIERLEKSESKIIVIYPDGMEFNTASKLSKLGIIEVYGPLKNGKYILHRIDKPKVFISLF